MYEDFPETFLPGVARAADAAMEEIMEQDKALRRALQEPRRTPRPAVFRPLNGR